MQSEERIRSNPLNSHGRDPNGPAYASNPGPKKSIRILSADGQTIFRDGLRALPGRVKDSGAAMFLLGSERREQMLMAWSKRSTLLQWGFGRPARGDAAERASHA